MTQETIDRIRKFTSDRDWEEFHTPTSPAKFITIEDNELLECFQWSDMDYNPEHVKEELADVMVYCRNMLDVLTLDEMINAKMKNNEAEYPVEKAEAGIRNMISYDNKIRCARIYYHSTDDGYRILVDRLWPRGIKKEDAGIDLWAKDIAPSNDLRKWFGHDPEKYDEFSAGYRKELDASPAATEFVSFCREKLAVQDTILLYAAKDEEHNNAAVLREWLLEKIS